MQYPTFDLSGLSAYSADNQAIPSLAVRLLTRPEVRAGFPALDKKSVKYMKASLMVTNIFMKECAALPRAA